MYTDYVFKICCSAIFINFFFFADNFYARVLGTNDQYYIERYSNQTDKLQPATGDPNECHQAIPTSSTATIWVAERMPGGDSVTGIKLYTMSNGNKWYLRVPGGFDEQPDLVCSDHIVSTPCSNQ